MEAEVNEHLLDQLNTLKSQASVRLRGSILIRSSFLYKSMSPCTKIKYKRGKQKHLFLPNPRAASEVTFSINLEKSMRRSKLCSDIYSTRRTFLHLRDWKKNKKTQQLCTCRSLPYAGEASSSVSAAFFPSMFHTNNRDTFRRVWAGWEDWTDWETLGLLCLGLCWNLLMELTVCCGICWTSSLGRISNLIFCYWRFLQGKQTVVKRRQDGMLTMCFTVSVSW